MIFGYQAVYDADFFDAIAYAKQNGFDFVSFDLNVPRFYIDQLTDAKLAEIWDYSEKQGVALAFHAPGDNISLYADYPSIRSGIIEHFIKILTAAKKLNARHVTIHPGNIPAFKRSDVDGDDFGVEYASYFKDVLYENLMRLAENSKDVFICVENFNFTDLTMDVLQRTFDRAPLFLTWDIPKTYDKQLNLNQTVDGFMRKNRKYIREIHFHDIKKNDRSHLMIGKGDLDFREFMEVFEQPELAGTIEVRPREEALRSMSTLRELMDAGK